ncbi:MAG: preprotein translocase subunit SecG [Planctomycetota bacterium]|nr:preprotein translocase subunit SecG [Planctomycetota bacterium]
MKDLLEHLKNYWKLYLFFLVLTAMCFFFGWLIGGASAGLGWALVVDGTLMIAIILLQQGRGGGLVGALGGMGGQSAFGARAGDAFTGITIVLTVMWVLLAGFGGITLRADRGSVTFDQPEVRLLGAISRWEGDDRMTVTVPVYLSGTPTEKVTVSIKAIVDNPAIQSGHKVDLNPKPVTFEANTPVLRQSVEIKYDGGTAPDGDWTFQVRVVNTENAIPKINEEISTVTIMDDDRGPAVPERKPPTSGAADEPVSDPGEKKPAVKKPAEKKPAEKKPAEKKPAEKKPAAKKPAAKKPAEKKSVKKKPAAKSGD